MFQFPMLGIPIANDSCVAQTRGAWEWCAILHPAATAVEFHFCFPNVIRFQWYIDERFNFTATISEKN